MSTTAARQTSFRTSFRRLTKEASAERYRRYANAKSRIPLNLPPKEYEARVQTLARKYKI